MIHSCDMLTDAAIDLADLCEQGPAKTVQLIHTLLLDDEWREARIGWLKALEAGAGGLKVSAPGPNDFTRELALLREPGLLPAFDRGLLSAERLVALTCDHQSLECVSSLIMGDANAESGEAPAPAARAVPAAATGDTRTHGETQAESWTRLIRTHWTAFQQQIVPWLPVLLQQAGLDAELSEAFVKWIETHQDELRSEAGRRLRDCWPEWVTAFARDEVGKDISPPRIDPQTFIESLRRRAVELALQGSAPFLPQAQEPGWVEAFRRAGREQQEHSRLLPQDLMLITLPVEAVASTAIASYRRSLVHRIEQAVKSAEEWL